MNLLSPVINKIHIFYELTKDPNDETLNEIYSYNETGKIIVNFITSRPSFFSLIEYANKNLKNKKIIISNGDILFDESIQKASFQSLKKSFFCLSRYNFYNDIWDLDANYFTKSSKQYSASFDSWIFSTPITNFAAKEFIMGTIGCEKFVFNALLKGIELKNPCKEILCYHIHQSNLRNYVIKDNYMNVPFVYLPYSYMDEKIAPIMSKYYIPADK